MTTRSDAAGRVAALFRYPVKSMLGEACATIELTTLGVAGDRRYAFIDDESGRVATAKNPRLWRGLLQCWLHIRKRKGCQRSLSMFAYQSRCESTRLRHRFR